MSSNNDGKKITVYTNPERNKPEPLHKPYVPQHEVHNKVPAKYNSAVVSGNTIVVRPNPLPLDNPRARRPAMQQPYAMPSPSPVGRGINQLPNVGNTTEQSWSSVDGQIENDLDIDPNQQMIDNNEVYTDEALGYQSGPTAQDLNPKFMPASVIIENDPEVQDNTVYGSHHSGTDNLFSILSDIEPGSYILLVSGVPICSGPKEEIEDQARSFITGENELCAGVDTPQEDIMVLKIANIKVGLFLE